MYPADSKLYLKAIQKLGAAARNRCIKLRQTYSRVAKEAAMMVGRYAHAKPFKRMPNRLRKLKTWLGEFCVICVAKFHSQMRLWNNC